jgi:hypothetical protein
MVRSTRRWNGVNILIMRRVTASYRFALSVMWLSRSGTCVVWHPDHTPYLAVSTMWSWPQISIVRNCSFGQEPRFMTIVPAAINGARIYGCALAEAVASTPVR